MEGFEKDGEEGQLYGLQLSDGVYKRKKVVTQEGGGAQKIGVERCRCVICRPQMASHAGVHWEPVGPLCGPRPRNGVARRREGLGSLRGDGPAAQDSGDKCRHPAVFLRPRDQERGGLWALHSEN